MGRCTPKFDAKRVAQRTAQGYGQGTGRDWKPWLSFGDFSSKGVTSRLYSPKLDRTLTFFSNVERNAFLIAEFLTSFLDYHEQGPMDTELTMEIARGLNVSHPKYPGTNVPTVLTYDGLLFTAGHRQQLIDCKHSSCAITEKEQVAYAMRHAYAQYMNWDILRITNQSYTWQRIHNLQWMRMSVTAMGKFDLPIEQVEYWSTKLFYALYRAVERGESQPVGHFVKAFATAHSQPSGLGLLGLRRLLWEQHVEFDLDLHYDWLLSGPVHALRISEVYTVPKTESGVSAPYSIVGEL